MKLNEIISYHSILNYVLLCCVMSCHVMFIKRCKTQYSPSRAVQGDHRSNLGGVRLQDFLVVRLHSGSLRLAQARSPTPRRYGPSATTGPRPLFSKNGTNILKDSAPKK